MRAQQMLVQRINQCLGAVSSFRQGDAKLLADCHQEFHRGKTWIEDKRYIDLGWNLAKQRSHQCCFSSANFACKLNEATAFGYAINEVRQSFAMALAHKQVTRIRRYRERFFV